MAVEWTQEERKAYLGKKFYTNKLRAAISLACLVLLAVQISLTWHFLSRGQWIWFFIFLVVTAISTVIIIFVIDFVYYSFE